MTVAAELLIVNRTLICEQQMEAMVALSVPQTVARSGYPKGVSRALWVDWRNPCGLEARTT